jgi:hypothetical protein
MYAVLLITIIALVKDPAQVLIYITSITFSWLGTLLCIALDELDELKRGVKNVRCD